MMDLSERDVTQGTSTLVGFNGEMKNNVNEIVLLLVAEGHNTITLFHIVKTLSDHNAILSKPWIHIFQVLPSMYH